MGREYPLRIKITRLSGSWEVEIVMLRDGCGPIGECSGEADVRDDRLSGERGGGLGGDGHIGGVGVGEEKVRDDAKNARVESGKAAVSGVVKLTPATVAEVLAITEFYLKR